MYSQPIGNHKCRSLVVSDLTLDHFKVKSWQSNKKPLSLSFIIDPESLQYVTKPQKSQSCESLNDVNGHLLLQVCDVKCTWIMGCRSFSEF